MQFKNNGHLTITGCSANHRLDNPKMYIKYEKFYQNISCGSSVMSIIKRPRPDKMMLSKASSLFCIPVARQCKINKYAKFGPNIQCGSRVMSNFID